MAKNFNTNTDNHDEWLTPPYITEGLGEFDLDPCSPINRPWPTANNHFTINDDGLSRQWVGRVWCNPPYGKLAYVWLERLFNHGNGIALIFARTETIGFHKQIWERADGIFFFKGRLKFHKVDGSQADCANAPSCLVAYGSENAEILKNCNFKGRYISLR